MAKNLLVYPEKCLGCRTCEMFCSLSHTDTCNPARSRVNIIKMDLDVRCVPMVCQQCVDPACENSCPVGAISRNPATGAMETDRDICIGCRTCVFACPFGGTSVDPAESAVIRCDLCQGEPKCVEACPYGAIVYVEEERQGLHKKRGSAERFLASLEPLAGKQTAG